MTPIPQPLPYHIAAVEYLRTTEPALWNWFSSSRRRTDEAEAVRLDLLKSTYRLEPAAQPKLYELAGAAREKIQITCAATLYQAQTGNVLNAALAVLPGEAHIILSGPIASVLSENELLAVFAHELAHFSLFDRENGNYLIASDLLRGLSTDPVAGLPAAESRRLYDLWAEIFADRWACHVCGDVLSAVAALIKVETGLHEASAESYLRQADEIFAKSDVRSDHISHPELYIRARALRLWNEQGDKAHAEIERMIEGGLSLNRLDLLGQKRAASLTREFVQRLLAPKWFRTEAVVAHARRFFPDFDLEANSSNGIALEVELDRGDSSLRDYLCYLMLDFVTVDRDLGDAALSAAIVQARQLGIGERFTEIAQKELSLGKKAFARIDKNAESLLAQTEAAQSS